MNVFPFQKSELTTPPSARNAAPFVAEESGLARNATSDATSSGLAKRCKSELGLTVRKNSCSTSAAVMFFDTSAQCRRHDALHTTFELRGKVPKLPPSWQENLLHIGQEALTNTLKYADAKNFRARLRCNAKEVRLELRDDGAGFELNDGHHGLGLTGMHERVKQMNGELEITSARGQGTNVVVAVPVNQEPIS